jgi:hypothetical protein
MDSMRITKVSFAIVLNALASMACWANDENLVLLGPSGRSSVNVSTAYSSAQYDASASGGYGLNSLYLARVRERNNYLALGGIWALSERISVESSLPWAFNSRSSENTLQGTFSDSRSDQVGYSLGLGASLLDSPARTGFRLSGYIGSAKSPNDSVARIGANLSPQYWLDKSLGVAANFGVSKSSGYAINSTSGLSVIWRTTPNLTLMPSVSVNYARANDEYSEFRSRRVSLAATYFLDRHWAAHATGLIGDRMAQTTASGLRFDNYRAFSASLGLRRTF